MAARRIDHRAEMRRFSNEVRKRIAGVLRSQGKQIRDEMRAAAPVHSGMMKRSIKHRVMKLRSSEGSGWKLRVGTYDVAAYAREFGVVVTPKKGKYLRVPLTRAAERLVRTAADRRKLDKTKYAIIKSKTGKLYIVDRESRRKRPLFALIERSTQAPRPFMRPVFERHRGRIVPGIVAEMDKAAVEFRAAT